MPKSDVIVVGSGIGGSSLVRALRARGIETTLISVGVGGSSAGLAISRPSYLPAEHRWALAPSLRTLAEDGATVFNGALVTSYQRPGEDPRVQKDWAAIEPDEALLAADVPGWADAISATEVSVAGTRFEARDALVWCDGEGSGDRTYGVTWLHPDPDALTERGLRVHHLAPYKTLSSVSFESGARFGSSSASEPGEALEKARKMFALATELGWLANVKGWGYTGGCRVNRPAHLERREDGALRWGGFHRSGYSLAPALAPRLVDEILLASIL